MRDPITLTLNEPIQAGGEQLTTLTIRPPKGKDLRIAGYPFKIGGGSGTGKGEMTIDAPAITKLVSTLAGIPPSYIDLLAAEDWNNCMAAVSGFLAPATPPKSETDTSSKPDGGETPESGI